MKTKPWIIYPSTRIPKLDLETRQTLLPLNMKHKIKSVAKKIDSQFDYSNLISFGDDALSKTYGEEFSTEFTNYFSNEWHGTLGDTIMYIDVPELISRAVRHAFIACDIDHIDNGNYTDD